MTDAAHYGPDGLVDLEHAKAHVRRMLALAYGDPLYEAQATIAGNLASQLALRPGRDPVVAGEALLEASQCLAGVASLHGQLHGYVIVLVNVLGITGLTLSDQPEAATS
jgi:hypothetical protein